MVEVVEVGGGSGGERAAARSVLSHFLFQLLELALRGGLARRAIHVRLEQLVLQVCPGPGAACFLDIAPGMLGARLCGRRALELRLPVVQLALPEPKLAPLRDQLALQHADALAVFGRETLGPR